MSETVGENPFGEMVNTRLSLVLLSGIFPLLSKRADALITYNSTYNLPKLKPKMFFLVYSLSNQKEMFSDIADCNVYMV